MTGIVFGKNIQSARSYLERRVILDYDFVGIPIDKLVHTNNKIEVVFRNGDRWYAIGASDKCRGMRCNVAYIDRQISEEIVGNIILPMTSMRPYNAFRYFQGGDE